MTTKEATAEVFWTAFRALTKKEKEAFVKKLLEEKEFREDLADIALLEQRRKESSRPLEEYLSERKKLFSIAHRREVYR